MEILIKEKTELEKSQLEYIVNGVDEAQDFLGNYENLEHDEEGTPIMLEYQFDWWNKMFRNMERIDELKETLSDEKMEEFYELEENGEFSDLDLEDEVKNRLYWLEEAMEEEEEK